MFAEGVEFPSSEGEVSTTAIFNITNQGCNTARILEGGCELGSLLSPAHAFNDDIFTVIPVTPCTES